MEEQIISEGVSLVHKLNDSPFLHHCNDHWVLVEKWRNRAMEQFVKDAIKNQFCVDHCWLLVQRKLVRKRSSVSIWIRSKAAFFCYFPPPDRLTNLQKLNQLESLQCNGVTKLSISMSVPGIILLINDQPDVSRRHAWAESGH